MAEVSAETRDKIAHELARDMSAAALCRKIGGQIEMRLVDLNMSLDDLSRNANVDMDALQAQISGSECLSDDDLSAVIGVLGYEDEGAFYHEMLENFPLQQFQLHS